jgi:serine/threonine protein kinase
MLPAGLVAALAPGTVISGKYRVEQPLGTGGMGIVVAARHLELNQNLAIKVLLPSAATSDEATTRFLREGRAAAQLTSPHVAKVHDTGRLPSGAPYLVMELLRGRDLRAVLAEVRRVPLAQAIEWTLQAAHALSEAHALKIIHRDVKPANLFLAETSAGQQIKVLDFGVSKQLDSTEADLTKTASAVGTPRYMAPEQMRSPRFADARGDVWSLGIVLYELTTGQSPFQGDSVTALCFDVMERTPAPPSQLNPALPSALDAIIARCLEKDPTDRFQSMEALATALGALAPGSRSSGLFNGAAMQAATAALGATPIPVSTLDPANATGHGPRTEPLAQPLFPELPPQDTMRSWDTTAVPRTAPKKTSRMPLVALGIGIGVGVAMLVGVLIDDGNASSPSAASIAPSGAAGAPVLTASPSASLSAAQAVSVVAVAEPPALASAEAVESAPSPSAEPSASAPPPRPASRGCNPPYTIENGIQVPIPRCL